MLLIACHAAGQATTLNRSRGKVSVPYRSSGGRFHHAVQYVEQWPIFCFTYFVHWCPYKSPAHYLLWKRLLWHSCIFFPLREHVKTESNVHLNRSDEQCSYSQSGGRNPTRIMLRIWSQHDATLENIIPIENIPDIRNKLHIKSGNE